MTDQTISSKLGAGELERLEKQVSVIRKRMERFAFLEFLLKAQLNPSIKGTGHYKEWKEIPLGYARQIELPLCLHLLSPQVSDKVLDISSPRLAGLYLAVKYPHTRLVLSDIDDYFVSDFETFREELGLNYELSVFDSQAIPYPENSFEKVYSISVLEHIPGLGDGKVVSEVARVLKPRGIFVVTLPAYSEYVEEWQSEKKFYWPTEQASETKKYFYQRRYDDKAIHNRLGGRGLEIEHVIYIAEHPIAPTIMDENGVLLHNAYHLAKDSSYIKTVYNPYLSWVPFKKYYWHRTQSFKTRYLTTDGSDPQVRQVAVVLRKS